MSEFNPLQLNIIKYLAENKPSNLSTITRNIHKDISNISYELNRLSSIGILQRNGQENDHTGNTTFELSDRGSVYALSFNDKVWQTANLEPLYTNTNLVINSEEFDNPTYKPYLSILSAKKNQLGKKAFFTLIRDITTKMRTAYENGESQTEFEWNWVGYMLKHKKIGRLFSTEEAKDTTLLYKQIGIPSQRTFSDHLEAIGIKP